MNYSAIKSREIFRANDWWGKASLLMGMIYLFTLRYGITFKKFIPLSILSLITIAGFASLGYLLNDLFDIKKDAIAGKKNFLAGKPVLVVVLFFLISLAFVWVPWVFLPETRLSFILIGAQIFLFLIYSAPPIRFKERGLAGIITDALYAHGLPTFLAAYTFALAAKFDFPTTDIWLLFAWQIFAGARNILLHQADDMEADKKSGSKNFVAGITGSNFRVLIKWLIGAELVLCLSFFGLLLPSQPLFAVYLLLVVILCVADLQFFIKNNTGRVNITRNFFPNNIYEKWLPVAYLALLATDNVRFSILFVLHIAIFNFDFYNRVADWLYGRWKSIPFTGHLITVRIFLSYPVNYSIYYLLRIFNIDLKKENTSAMAYFRKQWGVKQPQSKSGQS